VLSIDSCGGTLTAESGFVKYKERRLYMKEESCTWNIDIQGAKSILFKLEKSGLQTCCDSVTIHPVKNFGDRVEDPVQLM